jgi:hypothetical protein
MMRDSLLSAAVTVGIAAAAAASLPINPAAAQASAGAATTSTAAPKTPWGEPDLQGIWTDETATPLQRPAEYANQEFFTAAQRQQLDTARVATGSSDKRDERGTEFDVAGAYNAVFLTIKRTGNRTSKIVDPPNGRIPPTTPQAEKLLAADRDFRLALLQSTETCKTKSSACAGGKYDPTPSRQQAELAPRYNTQRINRHDGPEDGALNDRCLNRGLPEFGNDHGGSFRRIVQTPGGVTMFYDVGQGEGWQRNIVMDGRPHLPAGIRQWFGDSRGHWEGNTLVIDVTNFTPKTDYFGSRENLHLIERWTRTSPNTLIYEVTIEDPTVWTRPWTVKQEFTTQSGEENRIYYEPRCIEGNYAHAGLLRAARIEDLAFAEGRGADPATKDNATGFLGQDPFQ